MASDTAVSSVGVSGRPSRITASDDKGTNRRRWISAFRSKRYAEVKGRPKTLAADFIDDLLEVTGGGRARDFETARVPRSAATHLTSTGLTSGGCLAAQSDPAVALV